MKIYKKGIEKTWADAGVHTSVTNYVAANPGKTPSQIADALNLTTVQVSWAIKTEALLAIQEEEGEVLSPTFSEKITLVVASGTATKTVEISINGLLTDVYFNCPEIGALTNELKLKDADDDLIYATGEVADNTNHPIHLQRLLEGVTKVIVETSGNVGEDEIYVVKIKGMKLSGG